MFISIESPLLSRSQGDDREAQKPPRHKVTGRGEEMPPGLWLSLLVLLLASCYAVYHVQFQELPAPAPAPGHADAQDSFSEASAIEHLKCLTEPGPHTVASDLLDRALDYVRHEAERIANAAAGSVDVEVQSFRSKPGVNHLSGGYSGGKTRLYSDLDQVMLRILPKRLPGEEGNMTKAKADTILVSAHVDTVFVTEGAGDDSSNVAVMLELARAVSQSAHGPKTGIIFLFNSGEEDGLYGSHSFITQHPWSETIHLAVDLEARGIGGKSAIFQTGSDPWAIKNFARVAKRPSAQVIFQDIFLSGIVPSATDFQVYKEVGHLSGLDFAFTDSSAVYHTKNDKLSLLKAGSLQHLGDNVLAFLLQTPASDVPNLEDVKGHDQAIYFDILGKYLVVYGQSFGKIIQLSVIIVAFLVLAAALLSGGDRTVKVVAITFVTTILMMIGSLILTIPVAFILPHICPYPIPYFVSPWLIIGLFGAPAILGAFAGQHVGFVILYNYLSHVPLKKSSIQAKLEAERWLYRSGFLPWLVVLILGTFVKAGSSYIALLWLIFPAFAYVLFEAQSQEKLKIQTLLFGLIAPVLISGGLFIRVAGTLIGQLVGSDTNPGSKSVWSGNLLVAIFTVAVVCLTLAYLLSYIHLSGDKRSFTISMLIIFSLSVAATSYGVFPAFTDDLARIVNVVHVVNKTGSSGNDIEPISFVSVHSQTPGKISKELDNLKGEFSCGRDEILDFLTFTASYTCRSKTAGKANEGWTLLDVPTLSAKSESVRGSREVRVVMDTKNSTRWTLLMNARLMENYTIVVGSKDPLLVSGKSTGKDWDIIQFAGGKTAPRTFELCLLLSDSGVHSSENTHNQEAPPPLLKLRTDVNMYTPIAAHVLDELPSWCSQAGKSNNPYSLAFFTDFPVPTA